MNKYDMQTYAQDFIDEIQTRYSWAFSRHKFVFNLEDTHNIKKVVDATKSRKPLNWEEIYNNRNSSVLSLALIRHPLIPIEMCEKIATDILSKKKDFKETDVVAKQLILQEALNKDISETIKVNIIKLIRKDLFTSLSQYETPTFHRFYSSYLDGERKTCPYDDKTLKLMCESFLSSQQIQKMSILSSPFRLIKDNDYIRNEILGNVKCSNNIYTAIASNPFLDDDIRLIAAHESEVNKILKSTPEIQDFILDYYLKPCLDYIIHKNKSGQGAEKELVEKCSIEGFFDEEHQLKIVNKMKEAFGDKPRGSILSNIYRTTHSDKVLQTSKDFKTVCSLHAYHNTLMPTKDVESKVIEICEKAKKKPDYFSIHSSENDLMCSIVKRQTIPNECYDVILSQKNAHWLKRCVSISPYTPEDILEKLINETAVFFPEYDIFSNYDISYYALINLACKKLSVDSKSINRLIDCIPLKPHSNISKQDLESYKQFTGFKEKDFKKNSYHFISSARYFENPSSISIEKFKNEITKMQSNKNISPLLKNVLPELLYALDITADYIDSIFKNKCCYCSQEALVQQKYKLFNDFYHEFSNDPVNFFNYYESYLPEYISIRERILELEEKGFSNNDIKRTNSNKYYDR